jgi:di/tricarboxylate transporter
MYVFSRSVADHGLADALGRRFLGARTRPRFLAFRVTLTAGLLSSVISDAAVTATLLPVVHAAARRARVPASKLLMPLSFGSLLGGMVTVIGTSSNIAMNDVLVGLGVRPFGVFEFAHVGLVLLVVGALYFLGPGQKLLPARRVAESLTEHYRVPRFVTEVLVAPASSLVNRAIHELEALARHDVTPLGIVRSGGEILAPGPYDRIRPDDVLILQGEPESILRLRGELGLEERPSVPGTTRLSSTDVQLVEAVVPAGSDLAGRTLVEAGFRASTGLNALALSKHGALQALQIGHTRLAVGDTLLLQGHKRDVDRAKEKRQLLVLGQRTPKKEGAGGAITIALLLAVVLVSGFGWVPLPVCALAGALLLVLLRCVDAQAAIEAIDWSVIILIGGLLALGQAFDQHGLGRLAAEFLLAWAGDGRAPTVVMGLLLLGTVVLTQLTSNVSAVVVMTPVAVSLAGTLGLEPRTLAIVVLFGASCAFLSPVGHPANTMVAGPGDYRFRDFARVGAPLTVLIAALIAVLVPLAWAL